MRPILSIEGPREGWLPGTRPPHCDQRILHAAEECDFCAAARDLQAERLVKEVSCTGMSNRRWPCPADLARSQESLNAWPGNRPGRSS